MQLPHPLPDAQVQLALHELSLEGRAALQDALLALVLKFGSGPPQLLTQVCVAVAALELQQCGPPGQAPLLAKLLASPLWLDQGAAALLELLTVLAEECTDSSPAATRAPEHRRHHFALELQEQSTAVLSFLERHAHTQSPGEPGLIPLQRRVLRCLLSWVCLGCLSELTPTDLAKQPLFAFTFNCLQVEALFGSAVDVVIELLSWHQGLPAVLLPHVPALREALLLPALMQRQTSTVATLTRLLADLGHAAPALVAASTHEGLCLADSLIRCAALPSDEWDIPEATLPFWSGLAQHLSSSSVCATDARTTFGPVFDTLLGTLLTRSQIDGGCSISAGDEGSWQQFRLQLEETLLDICRLLGPARYLAQVLHDVEERLVAEARTSWHIVEARLFGLQTAADCIQGYADGVDLTPLFRLLSVIPVMTKNLSTSDAGLVHQSAAAVIGAYAPTFASRPEAISVLLEELVEGLACSWTPATVSSAAALRRLCEEVVPSTAQQDNFPLELLLQVAEGLPNMPVESQVEADVMCATAMILIHMAFVPRAVHALYCLLQPISGALLTLLEMPATEAESSAYHPKEVLDTQMQVRHAASRALHRLGVLCGTLQWSSKTEGTVDILMGVCGPAVQRLLLSPHLADESLASATCACLSTALQAAGPRGELMVEPILQAMVVHFSSASPHACFLRVASVVVQEHGAPWRGNVQLFVDTLQSITNSPSVQALTSVAACDQQPDIAEAFMHFAAAFVRCTPKDVLVLAAELLNQVLDIAAKGCAAKHRGAAFAALSFISAWLDVALDGRENILSAAKGIGPCSAAAVRSCQQSAVPVLCGLLHSLLGISALSRVHKISAVLQQLAALAAKASTMPDQCAITLHTWLSNSLYLLPDGLLPPHLSEVVLRDWTRALSAAGAEFGLASRLHAVTGWKS
eukprot:SM000207S06181  [mRNA]  locus=s207:242531:249689:+ [translate_table: standard]